MLVNFMCVCHLCYLVSVYVVLLYTGKSRSKPILDRWIILVNFVCVYHLCYLVSVYVVLVLISPNYRMVFVVYCHSFIIYLNSLFITPNDEVVRS